jgi:hypothetical protein
MAPKKAAAKKVNPKKAAAKKAAQGRGEYSETVKAKGIPPRGGKK